MTLERTELEKEFDDLAQRAFAELQKCDPKRPADNRNLQKQKQMLGKMDRSVN